MIRSSMRSVLTFLYPDLQEDSDCDLPIRINSVLAHSQAGPNPEVIGMSDASECE